VGRTHGKSVGSISLGGHISTPRERREGELLIIATVLLFHLDVPGCPGTWPRDQVSRPRKVRGEGGEGAIVMLLLFS